MIDKNLTLLQVKLAALKERLLPRTPLIYSLLVVVALSFCQRQVYAQATKGNIKLSGTVVDSANYSPVSFANVALYQQDKPVNGAVCDDQGKFELPKLAAGNYTLVISFLGFTSKKLPLTLGKNNTVDLGQVKLSQSVKLLNEVVVEGQKELVEEKVDRTIYNAENDMTTKGGDATDVLKRVPMLAVDMDGNVSIRGSANVKVLINNKPSTITANSVADALKQIPADMIKAVEVITSPSSKYDAEGSGGIINIVLKKNTLEGKFLTTDASAGGRGSNLGLNASYKKGKMGFSLGSFDRATYYVITDFHNEQTTRASLTAPPTLNIQDIHQRNNGHSGQYTFGWDYDINKFNALTVSARYGRQTQYANQFNLFTNTFRGDTLSSSSAKNVKTTNSGYNVDASVTYTKTFAKKDREFNFLGIYSRNNQTTGIVTNVFQQNDSAYNDFYKNYNNGHTQEVTLQADYQEPLSPNQMIEFGTKDIIRDVYSAYQYYRALDGGTYQLWNPTPSNTNPSNAFNYHQSVTSGYLSYTLNAGKDYTIKAGSRYEYTNIKAHFDNEKDIAIPSYGVLVPAVNISRKLKNGKLLKASYNRRIQRPNLQNLNPNTQYSNPLSATQGNPLLKPEYTDMFEIAYKTFIKENSLNISAYARNNSNDIQQARSLRGDTVVAIFQNIGSENNYGISIFANVNVTEKFTISGGTDTYYRILKNNSNDPQLHATNHGLTKNFRVLGNYNFPKGWAVQFFSFFQGHNYNLQGYRTAPINHSIGVRKELWDKKGMIGFGVDNFATPAYKVYSYLQSAYLTQNTTTTIHNVIVKVNFSYKIGKINRSKKKSLNEDEEN